MYVCCLKVIKREIRRQVRLPTGIDVERMEYRVTFDGHLLVLLLLGDADDDDSCQYRVTTLSATTLYNRSSCRGDGHDDDDDDGAEVTEAEQQLPVNDYQWQSVITATLHFLPLATGGSRRNVLLPDSYLSYLLVQGYTWIFVVGSPGFRGPEGRKSPSGVQGQSPGEGLGHLSFRYMKHRIAVFRIYVQCTSMHSHFLFVWCI